MLRRDLLEGVFIVRPDFTGKLRQSGGHLWQILMGTSLAPLTIGLTGYWVVGSLACLITGGSWLRMLWLILTLQDTKTALPMALLCCGCWFIAGVTLSEVRQSLSIVQTNA